MVGEVPGERHALPQRHHAVRRPVHRQQPHPRQPRRAQRRPLVRQVVAAVVGAAEVGLRLHQVWTVQRD